MVAKILPVNDQLTGKIMWSGNKVDKVVMWNNHPIMTDYICLQREWNTTKLEITIEKDKRFPLAKKYLLVDLDI